MAYNDKRNRVLSLVNSIANNEELMQLAEKFLSDLIHHTEKPHKISKTNVAKDIKRNLNVIVPVVCDDMFEYIDEDGNIRTIKDFICEKYLDGENDDVEDAIKNNFYYGISLLERLERESLSNAIHKDIKEAIEAGRIKLNKSVVHFLKNGSFPIIITTFGFNLIEKELELKDESTEWYNPNRRNDLPILKDGQTRVVYHIFGGETHSCWVYNEQTLLKFMHSLHSEDYGAKNLSRLLRKSGNEAAKSLLVLGSSLPDWLFRFFVYPMYEDEIKNVKGYWLSLGDIEKELDFFLDRNHYTGQTNLRKGNRVESILADATPDEPVSDVLQKKIPKIFVSYKREEWNTKLAEKIQRVVNILSRQGDVWVDTQEVAVGGNAYWAAIKKGIKDCDIFVPLVTERYMEDFRDVGDITKMQIGDFLDADNDNANDNKNIKELNPVVREAFYSITYKKTCSPIVICDTNNNINAGSVEKIAKDDNDSRNLPLCVFEEHTLLEHNDESPVFFNLPNIE